MEFQPGSATLDLDKSDAGLLEGLRVLLRLAWPIVLARSTQAVIGFADALMTAPLGEVPLAAATTGAINVFAITILPMGLVFIVQSFAAQLKGRGDLQAAVRYGHYALLLAAGIGVLAVLVSGLVPRVLSLFPYTPALHAEMSGYLVLRMWGVGAFVGIEALGNWFGGLGNTRAQMRAGLIAMVSNVLGNWLLITGNLGFPALGVKGAALASVIASWLGFAWLAWAFTGEQRRLRAGARLALRAREMWRVVRFGLPHGLNWFIEFGAFMMFLNAVVAHLGTTVLAAFMVVLNINSVAFNPSFGVSSAGAILVGQAIGAGEKHRVGRIVSRTVMVAAGWQGLLGIIYLLAPTTIVGWFASGGPESAALLAVGVVLLPMSAAWQLFDGVAMALGEALRAAGDTAWTLYARLLLAWVVFMPVAALGVYKFGGGAVFALLCVAGYIALLSGVLVWRFRSGAWHKIDLIGQDGPPLPVAD